MYLFEFILQFQCPGIRIELPPKKLPLLPRGPPVYVANLSLYRIVIVRSTNNLVKNTCFEELLNDV